MSNPSISPELFKELESKAVAAIEAAVSRHGHDVESLHVTSDAILCDLLNALGFTEVVQKFQALDKWYA